MSANFKIAVLVDPKESCPPSNVEALNHLQTIAAVRNIDVDFLQKENFHDLKNYQGLFIRTITSMNNYTYQWAEFAEYFGINAIDTTRGISLDSNKPLQFELCKKNNIPFPKTEIIYCFDNLDKRIEELNMEFPIVIKTPNGSCSKGVFKAADAKSFKRICLKLFTEGLYYSLIIQEFMYTRFDWRIGVINNELLYACKYYMVDDHWQIFKYNENNVLIGDHETFSLTQLPNEVLNCAKAASKLLDQGLYGIDIKEYNNKAYLIEINDNPEFYYGAEDAIDRENIYDRLLRHLLNMGT